MQESWVWSLGWEDILEKGKSVYPLQYSGLENSMDCIVHGLQSQTWLSNSHFFVTPVSANLLLLSYFELLKSLSLLFFSKIFSFMEYKLLTGFPGFFQSRRSQRATVLPHSPPWQHGMLESSTASIRKTALSCLHTRVSPLAVGGHCRRLLFLAVT